MARDGVIDTVSVLIEFLDEVRSADADPHGGGAAGRGWALSRAQ